MNLMLNSIFNFAHILLQSVSTPGTAGAAEQSFGESHFGVPDSTVIFILVGIAVLMTILIVSTGDAIKNLAKSKELWKNKNIDKIATILLLCGLFFGLDSQASAYKEVETSPFILTAASFWLMVFFDLFLFGVALYNVSTLKKITRIIRGQKEYVPQLQKSGPSWMENVIQKLTATIPIERESDVMTDHVYDDIRELDNNLPPWWKWMFYISIVWAFVYFVYFHVIPFGNSSAEEYQIEMAEAEAAVKKYLEDRALNVDENTVALITDEGRLASGKEIFMKLCKVCHGAGGEGGVGPNFADKYWIHGGSIRDLFKTIKYGVPQKGMISWSAQLSPMQMQDVASYIITLEGTNPPGQKEPQGELYERKVPGTETPSKDSLEDEAEESPEVAMSEVR